MPKSSSVEARTRRAWQGVALVFAATTVFVLVLFVRALGHHDLRSGLLTYGIFTSMAAAGLWRRREWGRGVALVVALGNSSLGAVATIAALLNGRGQLLGPVLLFVLSTALACVLNMRVFRVHV